MKYTGALKYVKSEIKLECNVKIFLFCIQIIDCDIL